MGWAATGRAVAGFEGRQEGMGMEAAATARVAVATARVAVVALVAAAMAKVAAETFAALAYSHSP